VARWAEIGESRKKNRIVYPMLRATLDKYLWSVAERGTESRSACELRHRVEERGRDLANEQAPKGRLGAVRARIFGNRGATGDGSRTSVRR